MPPTPSSIEPVGTRALPVPAIRLAKAWLKFGVSPLAMGSETTGTPAELVVPSYGLLSGAAVTVIGVGSMTPLLVETKVTE